MLPCVCVPYQIAPRVRSGVVEVLASCVGHWPRSVTGKPTVMTGATRSDVTVAMRSSVILIYTSNVCLAVSASPLACGVTELWTVRTEVTN